jgi:tRNA(Arg) A34 adenosine deaminase TadA
VAINDEDLGHLRRCVELARSALDAGDEPFGSLLVDADGHVRFEDRNQVKDGDATRVSATVYTSGEHCPMCSAAHAWVGLGRIVYATSTKQLTGWRSEWGTAPSPVAPLPITAVAPGIEVDGPAPELAEAMKALYEAKFRP